MLRVDDKYPTRVAHASAPMPRVDPTVWGEEVHGPLTQAALNGYSDQGYLERPETVSTEWLPPLNEELDRLGSQLDKADPRVIRESGGVRSVFEPHILSDLIAQVVELDTVLPVARQLLGSDVYIHQARINFMPGFIGTGFYWHSDFETWHAEDGMPAIRAMSCSIALTDNFSYNGSLMVMPGSHRTFYPCEGATPENNYSTSLVRQEVGIPRQAVLTQAAERHGIHQFTGPAGAALWFDANILHGSGSNITPFPRSNIFLVFNSVDNPLTAPFASSAPRPEYLAARNF